MLLPFSLENWAEIKALLDQGCCGTVQLKFAPRDDGHFIKEYVQWHPEQERIDLLDPFAQFVLPIF